MPREKSKRMNVTIEPERPEDRHTPFHKRIVSVQPIPNTKTRNWCKLECGHVVQTFGDLRHANGVALCMKCRDQARNTNGKEK